MGRFFITGSSDGLGLLTAKKLIASGHSVVLHARNAQRARDASAACPGAEAVLTADLSSVDEIASLAFEADRYGPYECIVHNAGVFTDTSRARDGYGRECSTLFVVNLLAPWMLTCLMKAPTRRLVYVSSGMHRQGRLRLLLDEERIRTAGYGDSKLAMVMLAKAVARKWGGVDSSRKGIEAYSADPGWVPTKMGGSSAPGDLGAGVDNFVRVALGPHGQLDRGGEELKNGRTRRNGGYWYNSKEENPLRDAEDEEKQDALLDVLKKVTGIGLPDLSNSREKILQV